MENFFLDNEHLAFHLSHPLMKSIVKMKEKNYTESKRYDYAPLDFEDAIDSYKKILEVIGEIAGEIIAPNAEEVDKEGVTLANNVVTYAKGTQQNHEVLKRAGMYGLSLPRKYDGLNFPMVISIMVAEIIARADASFSNIWSLQDCAETIHEFASEELKSKYLPMIHQGNTCSMALTEPDAGSDLQAVMLKAHYDNEAKCWRLNGVKRFITNGDADIQLVLARSEEDTTDARGLSCFLYDRMDNAVTIRRVENKLGIKGAPTCELVYKNAPAQLIGDERMGLIKYVMSLMNAARLGIGAQSVGLAEAAYREALKYANEREQFDSKIIDFPPVYEMLAGMRAKLDGARSLLYETSRFVDMYKLFTFEGKERSLSNEERNEMKYYQRLADVYTPLLKLFASEYCNQIAYDALQIHGGTGYMKDFPVERLMRDARITNIYEGTSQLQVVAAIRGVSSGTYLKRIKEYEAIELKPEWQVLKNTLVDMTHRFEKTFAIAKEWNNIEMFDFNARRLVEMVGNIVIGYLLILDAEHHTDYTHSAHIFIQMGDAQNREKEAYIARFTENDLAAYQSIK
ncbi:MAG: acyl-CoA dehydrogenase family protein [Bacteroidales bacterium]|jgi:alkylation response protein AidB-like acyl-CoA dehydrogenase|nr:acyl-CoA dehydrogenase family protein [Bacteroidales bacterium]MDD2686977.1 acyl-CoA dehydrogenase family protein [Bacteroidales bacterium]MDD3690982.1 acyl-CoA dehydrogenase family protein [Bacteroidales bacterium]NLO42994.1 acyl-CoA dehydrogenase [Bacteroidales bacterium]